VRFIELTCRGGGDRWDQHGNLKEGHENNARAVDKIGALLADPTARLAFKHKTLVVMGPANSAAPICPQAWAETGSQPFGVFTVCWPAGGSRGAPFKADR